MQPNQPWGQTPQGQTPPEQMYVLQEKLLSLSGDLWIQDAAGNRAFEVDGKAFTIRRTLILLDLSGQPLYQINASLMHIRSTFEIKRGDVVVATVQKALMTFLRDKFKVVFADRSELRISGNIWDHEFRATMNDREVMTASRRWLSLRGAYAIRVAPGFDAPLALAIAIALEQMEIEERGATTANLS
jgi:uncharacterized protein YxjI